MTDHSVAMPTWPHGSQDSIGQSGEFLVWVELMTQSGGGLHVFLPTLDRGLDGLVHRLRDRAYLAVQVKTKTLIGHNEAAIAVLENHLFTDDQLIVGVHLEGDRLGEYALVADAGTFRRKAGRIVDRGRTLLVADMPVRPIARHKWSDDLVRTADLATRLGAVVPEQIAPTPPVVPSDEDRVVGNWGENQVVDRLSMLDDCALFRPFPDNETAEVAIRRLATGKTIGIQVKTAQLDQRTSHQHIEVLRSSFAPDSATYVVALAWILPERRFHETCLLIPSEVLPSITGIHGPYYKLYFRPDKTYEPSVVDPYRIPLESLADEISKHLGR
jgi:hypothetical protein